MEEVGVSGFRRFMTKLVPRWPVMVTDARGKQVRLVGYEAANWPQAERAAMAQRVRESVTWRAVPSQRLAGAVVGTVVAIVVFAMLPSLWAFKLVKWAGGVALLVAAIPFGVVVGLAQACVFTNLSRWVLAQKTADAISQAGRCGSCGYPIGGAAEADGCVVGPGCGAAWRVGEQELG